MEKIICQVFFKNIFTFNFFAFKIVKISVKTMKKIAILISGSGTNLRNLAQKCKDELQGKCEIAIVVSNKEGVKGLEIASEFGLKTQVLTDFSSKISIVSNNLANYNEFAKVKPEAEKALQEIKKIIGVKGFEITLLAVLEKCFEKITELSDFPEEDLKELVFSEFFSQIQTEEEIDNLLYSVIEEIKTVATLFELVAKNPSFMKFLAREKYDEILHNCLVKEGIDYIFLAGFMRILSPAFVSKWEGKIFNIHPSLLPAFGGSKAVKEALAYGVKITGVTVHLVNSGVDSGQIIAQMPVEIKENDTEETLHERIKQAEKYLYPKVLEELISKP